MLRLGRASSAESSNAQSARRRSGYMGVWLTVSPPRNHRCPLCSKRFHSLKALGGHQNAHRDQRNEKQKKHTKILGRNRRRVRGGKRIRCHNPVKAIQPPKRTSNSHRKLAAPVANDPAEIDLELRLSCGRPKKMMSFYEFLPIKKGNGYGIGAPSGSGVKEIYAETHPYPSPDFGQSLLFRELAKMPVSDGADAGGVADDEPVADQYVGVLCGGRGTTKVISKTGLDVTLKLGY